MEKKVLFSPYMSLLYKKYVMMGSNECTQSTMESGEPDEELPAAKDVILGHVKVMKEILLEYFPGGKKEEWS